MRPWVHFLVSVILAIVFYPLFNWRVLFVFSGGFLVDIDHYLWYILKYKKFNVIECYRFFAIEAEENKYKDVIGSLLIFHTIEFLLLMLMLSFYIDLALIFTIGLLAHYLLDLIFLYFVPKRFIANHSLIWWLIKNRERQKF